MSEVFEDEEDCLKSVEETLILKRFMKNNIELALTSPDKEIRKYAVQLVKEQKEFEEALLELMKDLSDWDYELI